MAAEPLPGEAAQAAVARLLAERVGFQVGDRLRYRLKAAVEAGCGELGCDEATLVRVLGEADLDHPAWEVVLAHVTVGETYFFRDARQFGALRSAVLPALARERARERRLAVWSAACASGEEAYSLAILLREVLERPEEWRLQVVATDVNHAALRRGREGLYRPWSFRRSPPEFLERYFLREGPMWRVRDEIGGMVEFRWHNLLDPPDGLLPEGADGFDLILCRNVLMYMPGETRRRVAARLQGAVRPGGWLMVAAVELDNSLFPQLTRCRDGGVAVYRRPAKGEVVAVRPPVAAPAARTLPVERPRVRRRAPQTSPARRGGARPAAQAARNSSGRLPVPDRPPGTRREPPSSPALPTSEELAREAEVLASRGRAGEARRAAEEALSLDPLCGRAYHVLGLLALEEGDLERAGEALRRALYVDPGLVAAHLAMAVLAVRRGRSEAAARHRAMALEALEALPPEAEVPGEPGMTAERLMEMLAGGEA